MRHLRSERAAAARRPTRAHRRRGAFMLVEAVISILVVSLMLVAALNAVGAARIAQQRLAERARALELAQALMAEILQQYYADPLGGPDSFGLGVSEMTGNRSPFNDVDDYAGWQANPPQNKDGSVVPSCEDYEQVVSVAWVSPSNLSQTSGSPTGVKRIVVTIKRQGREVSTLVAFRTMAWKNPAELQGAAN